jgi:hypothetical protein
MINQSHGVVISREMDAAAADGNDLFSGRILA